MEKLHVRITLTEEMLGMMPSDKNIHEEFIASKAPDAKTREQEVEEFGVDEVVEKGKTVFDRLPDGKPCMYDYQIKGFFKDAVGMLRRVSGTKCCKLKAYKKEIDGLLFIGPRRIPIHAAGEIGSCQRPLRAQTMQGERVSLANSETVPAGSTIEFDINMLNADMIGWVSECLDYGTLRGLGQWRNSGKGTFDWEIVE